MDTRHQITNGTQVPDLDFCRGQLTSYEVHTLQESRTKTKKHRDNKRSERPPKQHVWTRVTRTKESYAEETILKEIRDLDKTRSSVIDKKTKLDQNTRTQVDTLLEEKNSQEVQYNHQFTWILRQLNLIKSTKTKTLVLYLERAPHRDVNLIALYNQIKRVRNPPPPRGQLVADTLRVPRETQAANLPPRPVNVKEDIIHPYEGPDTVCQTLSPNIPQERQIPKLPPRPVNMILESREKIDVITNDGSTGRRRCSNEIIPRNSGRSSRKVTQCKQKSTHHHSDYSRSSSLTRSDSSCSIDSIYKSEDNESKVSLISDDVLSRRRGGKRKPSKQHVRGYSIIYRAGQHPSTTNVTTMHLEALNQAYVAGFAVGRNSADPEDLALGSRIDFLDSRPQNSPLLSLDSAPLLRGGFRRSEVISDHRFQNYQGTSRVHEEPLAPLRYSRLPSETERPRSGMLLQNGRNLFVPNEPPEAGRPFPQPEMLVENARNPFASNDPLYRY